MLECVVLAAGASARMGSAKALLPTPDGRPFVIRVIDTLLDAGLARVTVVTGIHHDVIADICGSRLTRDTVRCVSNPDPLRGQLSSLLVGMDAVVTSATEGLLVTLVDVPMVATGTVRALIAAWEQSRAPIVRPIVGQQHGHPVIFDRRVFDDLRDAPLSVGAKHVIAAHQDDVENVPVDDAGCLVDVDTPSDYARLSHPG